ncbi:hypothetical protein G7Y89_g14257 [Cudoniella acicularis]|uniref:Major facilitator superfamily (MFS) profile domain-containing protein n=1 Tax=Cudoniella acicularis TaxID=354080 RepID=A0A8H4VUJ7_9HELO|nr:hypothetical protein G7Y89_g14257 [Cudoniella acicularis]
MAIIRAEPDMMGLEMDDIPKRGGVSDGSIFTVNSKITSPEARMLGEMGEIAVKDGSYALFTCIFWGYDGLAGTIVLAISQFRNDYGTEFQGQFVVSAIVQLEFGAMTLIGLMGGGALTAFVSKKWGRQVCMFGAYLSTILGVTLQFLSASSDPTAPSGASIGLFLAGKLFTGFPLGIFITAAPTYCSELAPLALRGAVTAAVNFSIVLGQCLAYVVMRQTQHLEGVNSYRILFAVQWVFAGVGIIILWWFPESPYLLVAQGKMPKAKKNIGRLHGGGDKTFDQDAYLAVIIRALEYEQNAKSNQPGFKECFRGTNLRRTMIAMSVFVVQAVCGISWIIGYMAYFLILGGMTESRAFDTTVLLSFLMLIGNTFSWLFIESFGRRSTALWGSVILFITLIFIGTTSLFPNLITAQVIFMGVWSFMYQATIGAVAWPIVSEVATSSLRGHTQSLATMTTGITGAVAGVLLPFAVNPDQGNLGGKIADELFFSQHTSTLSAALHLSANTSKLFSFILPDNMSSHPTVEYSPLPEDDSIRLMIVHPASPGSDIHCSLVLTTISECRYNIYRQYTALSYVWGNPTKTKTVFVDGAPFQATINLAAALDDLRDESQPLRLWVDAICIDQNNIPERNLQVGLMGDIYSLAQGTVVYLGNSNSEDLVTFLIAIRHEKWIKTKLDIILTETKILATDEILSNTWFTRVWTYQEMNFAKLLNIQDASIHRVSAQEATISPLYDILALRRGFRATDMRDIIYSHLAITGLSKPATITMARFPPPIVDYAKSVDQVFTDAARYIYDLDNNLNLLSHVEVSNHSLRRPRLPSWVPDWSLDSSNLPTCIPALFGDTHDHLWTARKKIYCLKRTPVLAFKTYEIAAIESTSDYHIPSHQHVWDKEKRVYEDAIRTHGYNAGELIGEQLEFLQMLIYDYWRRQLGGGILRQNMLPGNFPDLDHDLWKTRSRSYHPTPMAFTFLFRFLQTAFTSDLAGSLEGGKFAALPMRESLRTQRLALVPTETKAGDLIYLIQRDAFCTYAVLRPLPPGIPKQSGIDNIIREELIGRGCRLDGLDVFHATFVGFALVDKSYFDSVLPTLDVMLIVALH